MNALFEFPEPTVAWAWIFCLSLLALLVVAAEEDLRRMVIPKWVTIPMLALGLLFNLARGAYLVPDGWAGGMWNGFLLSLGGFATGFGLFLVMFILGTCGGGDVKLFAAVGAWVGPKLALFILVSTIILVILIAILKTVMLVTAGPVPQNASQGAASRRGAGFPADAGRLAQAKKARRLLAPRNAQHGFHLVGLFSKDSGVGFPLNRNRQGKY